MTAVARLQFVKVYSLPEESKNPAGFAIAGTPYQVITTQGDWVKIKFYKTSAWVKRADVELSGAATSEEGGPQTVSNSTGESNVSGQKVRISERFVKLTAGPDAKSRVLAFVMLNEEYPLIAAAGEYAKIRFKDTYGYVPKKSCVLVSAQIAAAPAESPAPVQNSPAPTPENEPVASPAIAVASPEPAIATPRPAKHEESPSHSEPVLTERTSRIVPPQTRLISPQIAATPEQGPGRNAPNPATFATSDSGQARKSISTTAPAIAQNHAIPEAIPSAQPAVPAEPRPRSPAAISMRTILWAVFAIFALLLVLFIAIAISSVIDAKNRKNDGQEHLAVIVGNGSLYVNRSLLRGGMPADAFLKIRGFSVKHYPTVTAGGIGLLHSKAEIMLIDWQVRNDTKKYLQKLSEPSQQGSHGLCIFYGVPAFAHTKEFAVSNAVSFVGAAVRWKDLIAILKANSATTQPSPASSMSVERYSFQGEIDGEALGEMLQFLRSTQKTGSLVLEVDGPFGMINFDKGTIVHSATKSAQDHEAIRQILDLKKGTFRFITASGPLKATTQIDVMAAMMEWAQLKDEHMVERQDTAR